MKKMTIITLLVLAALVSLPAESLTLDRETTVALALENNPDFLVSGISLQTAAREDRNVWNQVLPKISAGIGLNGGSSLLDSNSNGMTWGLNGSLGLSLPLSASLAYSIKDIQLAYQNEQVSYESARLSLIGAVEKEFYYLVASEENLAIEKANLELARERYEQAAVNYEYGLASELSVLQAEVSAANLEPVYLQTAADYDARKREFLIVLGLDPETEVLLTGSLDIPESSFDAQQLIELYLSDRQDIQSLQLALEKARNSRSLAVTDTRTPTLNMSAGWSTNVGDPFNAGSWNYNTWADGVSVDLSLNIPLDGLIPGSSSAMSIKSKEDEIEKASIRLVKAVDEARTEIINLVAQLETSEANMKLSELNVDLARKSFELSEESFSRGTIQRLDVEDAQQAYLSAAQQLLLSQYTYLSGLIDLRFALGQDNLTSLI
jgi:outer membrane protein TolC